MNFKKSADFFLIGAFCLVLFASSATFSYLLLRTLDLNQPVGLIGFKPFGYLSELPLPKLYLVQSGSMAPAIKTGSLVLTLPSDTYKQGEIISFKKGTNVVTHRIYLKLYPNGIKSPPVYKTAGDANEDFDSWEVKDDEIIGKVVLAIPYAGYLVDFAKKPQGFILLVIVPSTIIIYEEIRSLLSEIVSRVVLFLRRKKNENLTFSQTIKSHRDYGLPKVSILIPAIGSFLVVVALSVSFFLDKEKSANNILGAAETFTSPTPSEPPFISVSPSPTPEVQAGDVVVNEIYYDPDANHIQPSGADENNFEWVEIYNKSNQVVNLKDWKIEDNSGIQRTISTSNRDLAPNQFAILAKAANVFVLWAIPDSAEKIPLGEIIGNGLANAGDRIILRDSLGNIIDQVSYGTDATIFNPPSPSVAEGHSLERSPDGFDTDSGSDFVDTNPPTPGS